MENNIGERIAILRKQKGLTQLQLAEKLNISDKAVSKWESGKGDPSLELLQALSEVLDCTIDFIVKGFDKTFYMLDEEKFVKKCFDLLYEKVGEKEYLQFFETYKYVGIKDKCFCFEMTDKELYEASFDTDKYDGVFDELIAISMKLNKEFNGYKLKLVDNEITNVKKDIKYVEQVYNEALKILKPNVSAITYDLWISTLIPIRIDENVFVLATKTHTAKNYISKNFEEQILNAISEVDKNINAVYIMLDDALNEPYLKDAVRLAILNKGVNINFLQKNLQIGYERASSLINNMEKLEYISKYNGHNLRDVYINESKYQEIFKEPLN